MPGNSRNQRKRQSKNRKRPAQLSFNPTPLGKSHSVVIAYADKRTLTEAVINTAVTYTYSLNGPYDPNITGAGVQPVGFDPWMTMYTNFRVDQVRVEITFMNTSANNAWVGMIPSRYNALPSTLLAWQVDPCGSTKMLGSNQGNLGVVRIVRNIYPWQVLQMSRQAYENSSDFWGSAAINPSIQVYGMLFAAGMTTAAVVDTNIRISYKMSLFNPALQGTS